MRWLRLLPSLTIFLLALGSGTGWLLAQPEAKPAADDKAADKDGPAKTHDFIQEVDVTNLCARCHTGPNPAVDLQGDELTRSASFILLSEFKHWHEHDLHRRAFDALLSPLGKAMSQRLWGDETAASREAACLVCHATDTAPHSPLAEKKPDQFQCQLGVNCQACHGPAKDWLAEHFIQTWRQKDLSTKHEQFGMADLRNAKARAENCVTCHIGSAETGRLVTHEMYAVGHPPLPGFELATFSRDEPRHWRAPSEIPYIKSLDKEPALDNFGYRPGEVDSARLVADGAVVTMKASADLLGFEPDPNKPEPTLDFTHFNCAACHHDLRLPSDRQANGFPGVPGRPIPRTWPVWLTRVILDHAVEQEVAGAEAVRTEFEAAFDKLRKAFDARAFGDKPRVLAAAKEVASACDKALAMLDDITYDEAKAWSLLAKLAKEASRPPQPGQEYLDADGAYQFARAFMAIYSDLAGTPYQKTELPEGPPVPSEMKEDPKGLAELLTRLNEVAPLAVREKYQNGVDSMGRLKPNANEYLIQADLSDRLKEYYAYDSAEFRKIFGQIAKKLED